VTLNPKLLFDYTFIAVNIIVVAERARENIFTTNRANLFFCFIFYIYFIAAVWTPLYNSIF
jgi:hypothetical protein